MKFAFTFLVSLLFATYVNAIKCNSDNTLKRYQISKDKIEAVLQRETPPSKTEEKWYLAVCEEDGTKIDSHCNSNDVLCGLTWVSLQGVNPLVTQVMDFPKNIKYDVEEQENGFNLKLAGAKWGPKQYDALIEFHCSENKETDVMTFDKWQDSQVKLSVTGLSGCLKKDNNGGDHGDGGNNNDGGDDNKKPAKSSGSSWFTWLLLYALLFTLIYLSIISYANTRGGSFQDFKEEFLDRSKQLITSLPEFVREIASKLFGSSSSPRGGYSAV